METVEAPDRASRPSAPQAPLRCRAPAEHGRALGDPAELDRAFEQSDKGKVPGKKKKVESSAPKDPAAILKGENKLVAGKFGQAIQFTGDDAVDTPLGNFQREDPFSLSLWIQTPDVKERAVVLHRSQAWTDAGSRGYEMLIEEGRLRWSLSSMALTRPCS